MARFAEQMRAARLLVAAAEEGGSLFDRTRHVNLADVAMRTGWPVLVVGSAVDKLDLRSVTVGWKEHAGGAPGRRGCLASATPAPEPRTLPIGWRGTVSSPPRASLPRQMTTPRSSSMSPKSSMLAC